MTNVAALEARIAELEAEAKVLKAPKPLSLKVGQKGGASLYGLGRYPVTLYKGQWERLLEHAEEIKAFLEDHADELKEKA